MDTISPFVLSILTEQAVIDDSTVRLTSGDLGDDYKSVDDVLKRCGGKWNTSKQLHLFARGTDVLRIALDSGTLPPKNPLAFFPTPDELARQCLEGAGFCGGWDNVLEPSAGHGAFARLMRDEYGYTNDTMTLVEYDVFNCHELRSQGFNPIQADFLAWNPNKQFDSVVMNPPFNTAGFGTNFPAYMHHFIHAYNMWNGNGCFIAIVPPNKILNHCFGLPRRDCPGTDVRGANKDGIFQRIIEEQAHVHLIEDGAFRESGTMVKTAFVMIPGG